MRSSLLLLSGAAVSMAGPLKGRAVDIIVDVVTSTTIVNVECTVTDTVEASAPTTSSTEVATVVTVTAAASSTTEAAGNANIVAESWASSSSSSSTLETVVVATTSSAAAVAATTSSAAAVDAATSSAAAVGATTTSAAVVVSTTSSTSAASSVADTTSSASASASPTDFAGIAVYQHNIHRTNSSAPDVSYNDTAAGYAATLAARCKFEHDVTIGVTDGQAYGQNIAYIAGNDLDTDTNTFLASSITNSWFDNEIELYPGYGSEPDMTNFDSWGHYSQVVWKDTTTVGCAVQSCAAGTLDADYPGYFSVCNYWPAGNVDTEYAANVLAPLGEANVVIS